MIDRLKPYLKYKDTNLPWLNEVPAHWLVNRAKNVFQLVDVRSQTGDEELLTVSSKDGIVPRSQKNVTMFMAESYVGHKLCWPGDLVVNSLWAWAGGLGFSHHFGLISSAYSVYRPRKAYKAYSSYFDRLFRSSAYNWEFMTRSKGVWISRLQLSDASFFDMPVVIPPTEDQLAIARFLDHAGRKIRRYIAAKRKLIKLLEEEKQAIIHHAVTRGLDPNVRLKPSGVEWLGDIPEHWQVMQLRRISQSWCDGPFGSGLKSSDYSASGVRVIRLQNIGNGEFNNANKAFVSSAHAQSLGDHSVLPDDLLIAGLGDERRPTGRACVAPQVLGAAIVKADCFRFRLLKHVVPEFVAAHMSSTAFASSEILSAGATRQRINLSSMAARALALPPVAEQKEIMNTIESDTARVKKAIIIATAEINLLGEYQTRLISDVVTGKLDVREAAATLPDEQDGNLPDIEEDALPDEETEDAEPHEEAA